MTFTFYPIKRGDTNGIHCRYCGELLRANRVAGYSGHGGEPLWQYICPNDRWWKLLVQHSVWWDGQWLLG